MALVQDGLGTLFGGEEDEEDKGGGLGVSSAPNRSGAVSSRGSMRMICPGAISYCSSMRLRLKRSRPRNFPLPTGALMTVKPIDASRQPGCGQDKGWMVHVTELYREATTYIEGRLMM